MMNLSPKSLIACLTMMTLALGAWAQTTGLNYQAVARDGSGALLTNSSVNLEFEIRQGAIPGVIIYAEEVTLNTNEFGLFSTVIGENSPTNPAYDFELIDWAADEHYLLIELNGANVDTLRFQSVPYSRVATDMELEDLQRVEGAEAAVAGDVLQFDGSNWTAADAASPWIKTGNDLAYSPGKVFINRGFGITSAEYFGLSTPTTGNQYGGMYVNTESPTGRPFYGYSLNGTSDTWTYLDGDDNTWKVWHGEDRLVIEEGGFSQLLNGSAGFSTEGFQIINNGPSNNTWTWYPSNGFDRLFLVFNSTQQGYFDGNNGAYVQTSDRRLKRGVEAYHPVLDKVMRLQPYTYHYVHNAQNDPRSLGFIAQEVAPDFPELVVEGSTTGEKEGETILGINYAGFSVVAIKAIQEQQEVIEQQQQTIDELMRRLEALEAQVNE